MLHLETLPTTTKGKTMTKTCKLVIVPEVAWCECSPFPQAIHGRSRCPLINIAQNINGWLHLQFLSTTKVSTMSQRYLSASTVTPPTLLYSSSRMMQQQEISIRWVMSLRFCRNSYPHRHFTCASFSAKQGHLSSGESLSSKPTHCLVSKCPQHSSLVVHIYDGKRTMLWTRQLTSGCYWLLLPDVVAPEVHQNDHSYVH